MEQELAFKLQEDAIHPRNLDGSRVEESVSVAIEEVKPRDWAEKRLRTRRRQQLGEVIQETGIHDVNDIKEGMRYHD